MSCDNACYEAQVNGCSGIAINTGLQPSTPYYFSISKNNSNVHQRQLSTNADGLLQVPKDVLPAGYFTPGYYNIVIRDVVNYAVQTLVFNNLPYKCVLLQVVNIDVLDGDLSPITTIQ